MKKCSCGANAVLHSWEIQEDEEGQYTFDMLYVKCENCGKETELFYTEEEAIEDWERGIE